MKSIGVMQLLQKKFHFLPLDEEFKGLIGNLPESFNAVIFGNSGQGKTDLCIRLAKALSKIDKVGWWGYEQGHDADIQMAAVRNNLNEVAGQFIPIDPMEKLRTPTGRETMTDVLFEDLDRSLGKRNSPRFIFIDSIDYTGFTFDHYKYLKEKYKKKKGIIWISHAKGKEPKLQVAKSIAYDGQFTIYVKEFVAYVIKSRIGGRYPFIIWPDEVARRLENNPKNYSKDVVDALNALSL